MALAIEGLQFHVVYDNFLFFFDTGYQLIYCNNWLTATFMDT